jgi:hypothetical protein
VTTSAISTVALALFLFTFIGQAGAQEREVGPCGGTSVTASGRTYKCSADKKPVCNVKTGACYCVARPECRRR